MRLEFGAKQADYIGRSLIRGCFCQWPDCTAWGTREIQRPIEWCTNDPRHAKVYLVFCPDHREVYINLPVPKKRNMKMEGRRRWEPRGALAPSPNDKQRSDPNLNTS